ncbi:uncharacterized protein LOC105687457 isoform X2 [Athalia rosae]|uniref:uncharacterized protein LOC105687457 isoform X2 n=1 Tax=Athalia rosae TaxID=37344 RepID=UPI002033C357|nr:uncharacterized protein LOC105687457 isoform X2 [Athalia rosae]
MEMKRVSTFILIFIIKICHAQNANDSLQEYTCDDDDYCLTGTIKIISVESSDNDWISVNRDGENLTVTLEKPLDWGIGTHMSFFYATRDNPEPQPWYAENSVCVRYLSSRTNSLRTKPVRMLIPWNQGCPVPAGQYTAIREYKGPFSLYDQPPSCDEFNLTVTFGELWAYENFTLKIIANVMVDNTLDCERQLTPTSEPGLVTETETNSQPGSGETTKTQPGLAETTTKSQSEWGEPTTESQPGWGETTTNSQPGWGEMTTNSQPGWEETTTKSQSEWGELTTESQSEWGEPTTESQPGWGETTTNSQSGWGEMTTNSQPGWEETTTKSQSEWGEPTTESQSEWGEPTTESQPGWGETTTNSQSGWGGTTEKSQSEWGETTPDSQSGSGEIETLTTVFPALSEEDMNCLHIYKWMSNVTIYPSYYYRNWYNWGMQKNCFPDGWSYESVIAFIRSKNSRNNDIGIDGQQPTDSEMPNDQLGTIINCPNIYGWFTDLTLYPAHYYRNWYDWGVRNKCFTLDWSYESLIKYLKSNNSENDKKDDGEQETSTPGSRLAKIINCLYVYGWFNDLTLYPSHYYKNWYDWGVQNYCFPLGWSYEAVILYIGGNTTAISFEDTSSGAMEVTVNSKPVDL